MCGVADRPRRRAYRPAHAHAPSEVSTSTFTNSSNALISSCDSRVVGSERAANQSAAWLTSGFGVIRPATSINLPGGRSSTWASW